MVACSGADSPSTGGGSGGQAGSGPSGQGGSGGLPGGNGGGAGSKVGRGGTGGGTVGSGGGGTGGVTVVTGGTTGAAGQGAGGTGGGTSGGASGDAGVRPEAAAEAGRPDAAGPSGTDAAAMGDPRFSFFLTSLDAMRRLSKSPNGFGGDLRFGATSGLEGADKICQTIAADLGFGAKTWRAFLSVVKGPDGQPVHAMDRIGNGPWHDRGGRLIAMNKAGLMMGNRPVGDSAAVNDLPDETGQGTKRLGDTHDVITGTNTMGQLRYPGNLANTCMDWTSATGAATVGFGHAWPASSGMHWAEVHTGRSCAAGVNLVQNGGGNGSSIGAGGGWGGIYCFAVAP